MNRLKSLLALFLLVMSRAGAQEFRNPVIPGFHPDPSVCRVGDDYYLVNSSFQYFPGVPIFHSKDLVNWEQIGNVLDRESQLPLNGATSWLGIYAPTIRYHEGTFYMITTNVGNGGNFMVTAKDPRGPWSEPVWLKQQGIDPSLYFEGEKCYMVSNPDNTIMLCEINPQTGEQLTESKPLWQGTGGRYPEGPHIYKKDGYYYLLISEGGTELAHKLSIARSKKIDGPYEGNPDNPILTNCCMKGQGMQIQGTGHGDFVQASDGSWWVVFLAYRNFGGSYHHLGRETCLAPVEWKTGEWPVVNGGEPIDTLVKAKLPVAPVTEKRKHPLAFRHEWVYIQNPEHLVEMNAQDQNGAELAHLRLHASNSSLTENVRPSFYGHRQEHEVFTLEASVSPSVGMKDNGEAGLSVYQIHDGHLDFFLTPDETGCKLSLRCKLKSIDYIVAQRHFDGKIPVIRVRSDGHLYRFEYQVQPKTDSPATGKWTELGAIDCSLMSTEVAGGFTGVVVGAYAYSPGGSASAWSDFQFLRYSED